MLTIKKNDKPSKLFRFMIGLSLYILNTNEKFRLEVIDVME